MENASQMLANEYIRLGGRRIAVVDDNLSSTLTSGRDTPEAEKFWRENVESLDDHARRDVELFLRSVSEESDDLAEGGPR